MILVGDNWEEVRDLQDISNIIREYYNMDLADEMDKLISEHSDEEYEELKWELEEKDGDIASLEDEVSTLENKVETSEEKIDELESK